METTSAASTVAVVFKLLTNVVAWIYKLFDRHEQLDDFKEGALYVVVSQ